LQSTNARGNSARSRGAPRSGASPQISSTKQSSDLRSVSGSSREAARNSRGYWSPLWGDATTSGRREAVGSRISKGRGAVGGTATAVGDAGDVPCMLLM